MEWKSVAAGSLAALASVLGKYAFSAESPIVLGFHAICAQSLGGDACWLPSLVLRGVVVAAMLWCNALMMSMSLKAMHAVGSLNATVTTSAVNFVLSGLLGSLLFSEGMNLQWCFGASLIVCGVAVLAQNQKEPTPQKYKE